MSKSEFSELLQQLGGYSERVDAGKITDDDFIEYQRLEARIIDAYQKGSFHNTKYRVLMAAYCHIKEEARQALRLDRQ